MADVKQFTNWIYVFLFGSLVVLFLTHAQGAATVLGTIFTGVNGLGTTLTGANIKSGGQ
jgi:hypothetical protein